VTAGERRMAVRAQVRAYCLHLKLGSAHTAACLRQVDVLIDNGNTPDFAHRQAEALADRISDRLIAAAQAANARQPGIA